MPGPATSNYAIASAMPFPLKSHPRSGQKRNRILEVAALHFAERGYHAVRVGDIAAALGIAKGSIFQHFTSKDGLFLEVYKRAVRSFPQYLDAPAGIRKLGFFAALHYWLDRTEMLVHEDWIPYRIALLGNHGTDLSLRREIHRFLVDQDPYGTGTFVRFGLERGELRPDLDFELIASIIDWSVERFEDTLLTAEREPGLLRHPAEASEKQEARIQQFLSILQRAIGTERVSVPAVPIRKKLRFGKQSGRGKARATKL